MISSLFRTFLVEILLCLVSPYSVNAGQCTSVLDGDIIIVEHKGSPQKVRLFGIDAPENGQPGSDKAKAFLESLVLKNP